MAQKPSPPAHSPHLAAGRGATLITGSPLRLRIWASSVWPLTGAMDVSVTVESRPAADSSSRNRLNESLNSCGAQDEACVMPSRSPCPHDDGAYYRAELASKRRIAVRERSHEDRICNCSVTE